MLSRTFLAFLVITVSYLIVPNKTTSEDTVHVFSVKDPDAALKQFLKRSDTPNENSDDSSPSDETEDDVKDNTYGTDIGTIQGEDFKYVGCFDVWENEDNSPSLFDDHFKDNSITKCYQFCEYMRRKQEERTKGKSYDFFVAIRAKSCFCPLVHQFNLVRVQDRHCNLHCQLGTKTCGGRFSASIYCADGKCKEAKIPGITDLYEDDLNGKQKPPPPAPILSVDNYKPSYHLPFYCGNCTSCFGTFRPRFVYIPENNAKPCAEFCRRQLKYSLQNQPKIREPMPFALTGWTNRSFLLPTCACAPNFDDLILVSPSQCNTKCNNGEVCGSDYYQFVVSISLTGVGYNPEIPEDPQKPIITDPTPVDDPTTTTTFMTTPYLTSSSTPDSSEESDEISTTPSTQDENCSPKCRAIDPYGQNWIACPGTIKRNPCPNKANGTAIWRCLDEGKFEGETPNFANCKTAWIQGMRGDLQNPENGAADKLLSKMRDLTLSAANSANNQAEYFGHEIPIILDMATFIIKHENLTDMFNLGNFEGLTQLLTEIGGAVLSNPKTWKQLTMKTSSASVTTLIETLDSGSFELASKAIQAGYQNYTKRFTTSEVVLKSGVAPANETFIKFEDTGSRIRLPVSWTNRSPFQFVAFSLSHNTVFPLNISDEVEHTLSLNGKVISLSVLGPSDNSTMSLSDAVEIRIQHAVVAGLQEGRRNLKRKLHINEIPKAILGTAVCVYWDTETGIWSTNGCRLISSESLITKCECSHLTSFAVLMDRFNYIGKPLALEILTLLLCSLSVVCLFVTVLIFSIVKTTHGTGTTITKNLAICLLLGNTLVLVVVDRHYFHMSEGICIAAAIVTHYAFLSVFMWMGIEGYTLYKMMVHVFDSGRSHMTLIRILAYGVPLTLIIATAVTGAFRNEQPYGGEEFCWLNGKYSYFFMVPVALVVVFNFVVLIITMRTAYMVKHTGPAQIRDSTNRKSPPPRWIRGCVSISVLLGITWIIGYFQMVSPSTSYVVGYIFTVLNASQGFFIFIYHCLLNDKVRMALERRNITYPPWLSKSTVTTKSTAAISSTKNVSSSQVEKSKKIGIFNPGFHGGSKKFDDMGFPTMQYIQSSRLFQIPKPNTITNVNRMLVDNQTCDYGQRRRLGSTVSSIDSGVISSCGSSSDQKSSTASPCLDRPVEKF